MGSADRCRWTAKDDCPNRSVVVRGSALSVARHRLVMADGQRFAATGEPVVVAERSAAAGRDDDVQPVAAVADLVRPLARLHFAQPWIPSIHAAPSRLAAQRAPDR